MHNIPDELRTLPQWVTWRIEKREGKDTKVPYQTNGKPASSTDPKTWTTFAAASGASRNVGFVFTKAAGYVGIDFDRCRDPKSQVTEAWALAIIKELDSYTELSQSGTGWHVIIRGSLPPEGRHPQASRVEMYDSSRYFCMTGIVQNQLGLPTIEARDVSALHARMMRREFVAKKAVAKRNADESAEDYRLIGEAFKECRTTNADHFEKFFAAKHPERYAERNKVKKHHSGKNYFRYSIERFLLNQEHDEDDESYAPRLPITEMSNAERLVEKYSDEIRYCSDRRVWCAWDGATWNVNDAGGIARRVQDVSLNIYSEIARAKNKKLRDHLKRWAVASESRRNQENSAALARYFEDVEVREFADVFDTHPMLLNVKNGTLDLRTGKLSKHRRENFITKIVPMEYDEDAGCERFTKLLADSLPADGLALYLWKVAGYCLTGMTSEQKWWMFHGVTASGKSTLINVLHGLLGPYAMALPENYFLVTNNAKDYATANLAGVRLATCVETNEGRRLDTAKLKSLTGGDVISAELKYQNCFTFRPQMKLILATNNRPHVSSSDDAIWRRLIPVPFTKSVDEEKRIADLSAKLLEAEGPGILRWAVFGCRAWLAERLSEPEAVKAASVEYRTDEDNVQRFLNDCCVMEEEIERKELYGAYVNWCKTNHAWQLASMSFARDLYRLGIRQDPGKRKYFGVRLRGLGDTVH